MKKDFYEKNWLKAVVFLLFAAVTLGLSAAEVKREKPEGSGTVTDPYLIDNVGNLYWFADLVDGELEGTPKDSAACAKLTNDIVVNEQSKFDLLAEGKSEEECDFNIWKGIAKDNQDIQDAKTGNYLKLKNRYSGTFDGDGHSISGIYGHDGFFFSICNATIKKLSISGINDAGICVISRNSEFISCTNYINTTGQFEDAVGGIVGLTIGVGLTEKENQNIVTKIIGCSNYGTIKGKNYTAGICGLSCIGALYIEKCANYGDVELEHDSNDDYVAGILADTYYTTTIKYSFNQGNIRGNKNMQEVGTRYGSNYGAGILAMYHPHYLTITSCYDAGLTTLGKDYGSPLGNSRSAEEPTMKNFYALNCYFSDTYYESLDDFESGKVTYLLNSDSLVYVQTIGVDKFPRFNSESQDTVYRYRCEHGNYNYVNHVKTQEERINGDGICECGKYEAPQLVDGYYILMNKGNLYWFSNTTKEEDSVCARLGRDIVIQEDLMTKIANNDSVVLNITPLGNFTPIGSKNPYKGTFLGDGHSISGLYYKTTEFDSLGLFSKIGPSAILSNIHIKKSYIEGKNQVGALCGFSNGTIENCTVGDSVRIIGNSYVGGIVGVSSIYGSITNCVNNASISSTDARTGGICGSIYGGSVGKAFITNCHNNGSVTSSGSSVGGIAGYAQSSTITKSVNDGNIKGSSNVAGIVGERSKAISNCCNRGEIKATSKSGIAAGIVASLCSDISNCYNVGAVKGNTQYGISNKKGINCYILDNVGEVADSLSIIIKEGDAFQSGEVAYLLQGDQETLIWGQEIGKDEFPVLCGTKVLSKEMKDGTVVYYNEGSEPTFVEDVTANKLTGKVTVYDPSGKVVRQNVEAENCLDGLTTGIYIIEGRKFLIVK